MTTTLDITPDALEQDTEEAFYSDMQALSRPTLEEYWLNDEDAVYDTLCEPTESQGTAK